MNDAQSTIAGLKTQDCPGGGWSGQPAELECATVADCLAHGVCGCIYGDAVQHIERLRAQLLDQRCPSDVRSTIRECIAAKTCGCTNGLILGNVEQKEDGK